MYYVILLIYYSYIYTIGMNVSLSTDDPLVSKYQTRNISTVIVHMALYLYSHVEHSNIYEVAYECITVIRHYYYYDHLLADLTLT